jgi:transposase
MLTIGVDSHKGSYTAVAIDPVGAEQSSLRVSNTPAGRGELVSWVKSLQPRSSERQWGIEGSGTYGLPLAQQLSEAGDTVFEVPGLATSRERSGGLGVRRQKNDYSDAHAIARVALWDSARLPRVFPAGEGQQCKLLTEHRDNLVLQRTRVLNQLHAHTALMDGPALPGVSASRGRRMVTHLAAEPCKGNDPLQVSRAHIIQQLAQLVLTYDDMIRQITDQLGLLANVAAPALVALRGAGALTAAKIIGEAGDVRRFATPARFASYAGVAPLEASSGDRCRHRLSRRGNRQLNRAIHMIAVTQRRWDPRAKEYLERKLEEGKTRKEALRSLKRHLANVVFRLLQPPAQRCRRKLPPLDIEAFSL